MPQVEAADGTRLRDGDPHYSDALRALVGTEVVATEELTGAGLHLRLRTMSIAIDPTPDDLVGPEIAILRGFADRSWMCWRPGEEAFEHLR